MLSRSLKTLVTLMAVLAVTISGLPLVLCVSPAHGAAIEIESAGHNGVVAATRTARHLTLLGASDHSSERQPCHDTRLQRGAALTFQRSLDGTAVKYASGGPAPVAVPTAVSASFADPGEAANLARCPRDSAHLRTSLSDLRTIVLQI